MPQSTDWTSDWLGNGQNMDLRQENYLVAVFVNLFLFKTQPPCGNMCIFVSSGRDCKCVSELKRTAEKLFLNAHLTVSGDVGCNTYIFALFVDF